MFQKGIVPRVTMGRSHAAGKGFLKYKDFAHDSGPIGIMRNGVAFLKTSSGGACMPDGEITETSADQ